MAARTGGRTQQGKAPAQDATTAPAGFGPATGSAPDGPPPAGPPRTGGRTQQGTQRGARSASKTPAAGGGANTGGGQSASRGAASPPAGSGGRGGKVTDYGGGLVVAAFAWPLGLNLLKGGPAQMWGWVKAKFLNEPYAGSVTTGGRQKAPTGQPQQPSTTGPGPRLTGSM